MTDPASHNWSQTGTRLGRSKRIIEQEFLLYDCGLIPHATNPGVRGDLVSSAVTLQDYQRVERLSTAEPLIWSGGEDAIQPSTFWYPVLTCYVLVVWFFCIPTKMRFRV